LVGRRVKCPLCGHVFAFGTDVAPDEQRASEGASTQSRSSTESEQRVRESLVDELHSAAIQEEIIRKVWFPALSPIARAFSPLLILSPVTRRILGFGIFPLLLLVIVGWQQTRVVSLVAFWISLYFCMLWAVFFGLFLSPSEAVKSQARSWAVFTALIGVPILMVVTGLVTEAGVLPDVFRLATSKSFLPKFIGFVLCVGVLEELCKVLPLLTLGRRRRALLTPINAMYIAAISGLAFSVVEASLYTRMYWSGSAVDAVVQVGQWFDQSRNWYGGVDADSLRVSMQKGLPKLMDAMARLTAIEIVRFVVLPFLHAAWAGIAGYFVGLAYMRGNLRWHLAGLGIGLTAVLHGLYDSLVGSATWLAVAVAAFSVLVFVSYVVNGSRIQGIVAAALAEVEGEHGTADSGERSS